ncbi:hypothetical protein EPUS_01441 [Endocarpon pusillum Z07020]|uniref:Uncharacterized protein n=1 Tax=Endocarpon pusillum (strain Z07020 / HMAS-L-300199) TaxID=1263415 RepID=U1GUI3_ENDPU|nr:uncharacterized protein EPUS_01441 [Endocarpon pusillum Z07020]ERF76108.1 hypothetical protein EPUS_01441 [Endocarpon pusillum Z07020]
MRSSVFVSVVFVLSGASASFDSLSPYVNPLDYTDSSPRLFKRQGCPGGFTNCGALGNSGACCPTNQVCARDSAGNVACCPVRALCTGTIGGTAPGTGVGSSTGAVIIGGSTGTPPSSVTATSGFLFSSVTTTPAPSFTGSTVPGAVFPFVFIPTTFANAAECSSYATSCSNQYQSCLATLGGGVNGVTVSGANVGITVQGASTTVASASSVCSSLSQQACYGLQTGICPQYGSGTGTGGGTGGFAVGSGAAARATGCPGIMYAVGAGAMAGAAGAYL